MCKCPRCLELRVFLLCVLEKAGVFMEEKKVGEEDLSVISRTSSEER